MSQPRRINRNFVSELRKQLEADDFIQLLSDTTLFRGIPPASLPLNTLEEIFKVAELIPLNKNHHLPVVVEDLSKAFVFEILSGFVKIYDRPVLKSEKRMGLTKNPPALLAWRIPKELLGDFQFTIPEAKLEDHIEATDKCRLLKVPASLVNSLAQRYPQIYLNIASNLASKANKARVRAQILRLPNIESMLAKLFIELLKERGTDSEASAAQVVNGTFRIDDIAAFLGYETRSTQAGIHNLINDHHLIDHYDNQKSGRFIIRNEKGLHKFVEQELARAHRQKKGKNKRRI